MPNIFIEGSHGHLIADLDTGVIVERSTLCDCEDCATRGGGYDKILFFDPLSFDFEARKYASTDILYVSAIYADGGYTRAMGEAFEQRAGDTEGWYRSDEVYLLADLRETTDAATA